MSHPGNAASSPPRTRAAPDGSVLQSTPSSRGLAASEQLGIHSVRMAALQPWVVQDVSNAEKCKADKFLALLLQRASQNLDSSDEGLLERCLDAVVPFCNGGDSDPAGRSPLIRDALSTYAKSNSEVALYAPFVKASNNALNRLKTLGIEGMRTPPSDRMDMFFQRNDPKRIT
ncbi:hypothetical protein BDN67DRAFT_1007220 [Paxillus ammoniavirescens]|nr:hypothetical protein BDN67DRAFT_1007220 [Paxillus ammoniavirescens]